MLVITVADNQRSLYWKLACTVAFTVTVTLQTGVADKLQAPAPLPVQFTNRWPAGGAAVSVTVVPWVNLAEQKLPQLMLLSLPAGTPVTVPDPERAIDKVN